MNVKLKYLCLAHRKHPDQAHLGRTAAAAKSLQSCPTLCDSIDGSPPGSPIPGILQARTLEWVAISSPMHGSESEVAQSCPTLLDPMDCSLPGSSIHGICQARVLEWGAIAFLGKDCSKEEINTFSLEVDRNQEIFDFTPSLFSIKEA